MLPDDTKGSIKCQDNDCHSDDSTNKSPKKIKCSNKSFTNQTLDNIFGPDDFLTKNYNFGFKSKGKSDPNSNSDNDNITNKISKTISTSNPKFSMETKSPEITSSDTNLSPNNLSETHTFTNSDDENTEIDRKQQTSQPLKSIQDQENGKDSLKQVPEDIKKKSSRKKQLVACHAVQCGFDSPGTVVSMFNLLLNNSMPTMQDIQTSQVIE